MIEREKRQIINAPPMQITDRWDQGEDHQAPEVYVALPPADGIPGTDAVDNYGDYDPYTGYAEYENNLVGSAECDIYRIVRDGSHWRLEEVSGLSKTVYNLTDSVISQAFIPIMRDKFGNWIAGSTGGGNTNLNDIIDFTVVDYGPSIGLIDRCNYVRAIVTNTGCGSSVEIGSTVFIWDKPLCWFNLPTSLLIGLTGTAHLMKNPGLGDIACPSDANEDAARSCVWVVKSLCCYEESYD